MRKHFTFFKITTTLLITIGAWGLINSLFTKPKIELRVSNPNIIISKPEELEHLQILYNGEQLDILSKTTLLLINTGYKDIHITDFDGPITIIIDSPQNAGIIDVNIDRAHPPHLKSKGLLQFDKKNNSIHLSPLIFNRENQIEIGVLSTSESAIKIKNPVESTILGLNEIPIVYQSTNEGSWARLFWKILALIIIIFSGICTLGLFSYYLDERKIKKQIKNNNFNLPNHQELKDWLAWIDTNFKFTTSNNRFILKEFFINLSSKENDIEKCDFIDSYKPLITQKIEELIKKEYNLESAIFCFAIFILSLYYFI